MRSKLLVIGVLLLLSLTLSAQIGTRFWFAAPSLTNDHDQSMSPQYSLLCFSSYNQPATITVTQPGVVNPSDSHYFAPYTFTLPANSTVDVRLSNIGINRAEHRKIMPYGVYIESDADISVYFAQTNANSEIYTLKGDNALGTDFIVGMQNTLPTSHSGFPSVEILATEDNTIVHITSPVETLNSTDNTWQVTLNRGDVYTVVAKATSGASHMSGMHISADKPIAVNSTDDSVASWGQDLCGDQLVPTNLAGSEYVAIRNTAEHEKLYVYALRDNTQMYLNGVAQAVLNTGTTRVMNLPADVNYLRSDDSHPIVVFQLTGVGGETGATQLPKLNCTGSSRVVYVRRFAQQPKVLIVVKTQYVAYFSVNGNTSRLTAADFSPVPDAPEWSWCSKLLSPESGTGYLQIENDSTVFHMGVLDWGGGGTCTYGYFSDFNAAALYPQSDKQFYTVGETIHLSLQDAALFESIEWTLADGTTIPGEQVYATAQLAHSGYAYVKAVSKEGCALLRDSFPLLIHVVETQRIDSTVCDTLGIRADSVQYIPVQRSGNNIIDPKRDTTITCAATPQVVWKGNAQVSKNQLYRLQMTYAAGSNLRKPRVEVRINDEQQGSVLYPSVTPAIYTCDWVAPSDKTVSCTVNTVTGSSNNAELQLTSISFAPIFDTSDSIVFAVRECPADDPPLPPDPDYPVRVTLLTQVCTACDGDPQARIDYRIDEGEVHTISADGQVYEATDDQSIYMALPTSPGSYRVPLVFCDTVHHTYTDQLFVSLAVLYQPLRIFTQKWGNTLAAYTESYSGYHLDLYDFQWWENGVALEGENASYLYMPDGFPVGAVYQLTAKYHAAGTQEHAEQTVQTCPYIPNPRSRSAPQIYRLDGSVVPNRSAPGVYIISNGTYIQKIIVK